MSIMYILGGGMLKEDFIVKHTKMIVLVVFLMIAYISNRYSCITKVHEIERLEKQLREVRYESLLISTRLTGNTRPSLVEEDVKKMGLEIEKAKTPPYKLHK